MQYEIVHAEMPNLVFRSPEDVHAIRVTLGSDNDRHVVETMRAQALTYVWGWEDGSGQRLYDGHVAYAFALAYAYHAARYASGKASSRYAIPRAWELWSTGRDMDTEING